MNIHVPAQRTAPDQVAATAAPAPAAVELGWAPVLRGTVARASLAMVVALVIWSVLPLLAGWTPRVILSGSMEPRIHVGDIIVTRTVPAATVTKGQVITVKDPDHPEKTRTHRVLRRAADGTIVTKGDANPQADSSHISNDDVRGLGVVRVPYVGRPAYWMAEHNWLALGATTLFLGWCLVTVLPGSRRSEDDDDQAPPVTGSGGSRSSRPRRVAATVAVAAMALTAATGPAEAAFHHVTTNPASTWSAAAKFTASYAQTVLGDTPQFYWRLDAHTGSSATDAKNGHNGQVTGSSSWGQDGALATDTTSTALRVDGGYVNQPASLSSGKAFSVETWFQTSSSSGGPLMSLVTPSGVERSLYLGSDGQVRFSRNRTALVTSTKALNNGQWHHIVYTNASTGNSRAKLYVDGSQVSSASKGVTSTASGNWRAGQAQWNASWDGNPDQYFRGNLDEIAIYTDVLTPTEIAEHYTNATQ